MNYIILLPRRTWWKAPGALIDSKSIGNYELYMRRRRKPDTIWV